MIKVITLTPALESSHTSVRTLRRVTHSDTVEGLRRGRLDASLASLIAERGKIEGRDKGKVPRKCADEKTSGTYMCERKGFPREKFLH